MTHILLIGILYLSEQTDSCVILRMKMPTKFSMQVKSWAKGKGAVKLRFQGVDLIKLVSVGMKM